GASRRDATRQPLAGWIGARRRGDYSFARGLCSVERTLHAGSVGLQPIPDPTNRITLRAEVGVVLPQTFIFRFSATPVPSRPVHQAIQQRRDHHDVAQELRPVLYETVVSIMGLGRRD